jgi:Superinfection immunity protein
VRGDSWGGAIVALESVFFFPFFGFGFVLYFLPWIIALVRSKRDTVAIFLLNLCLGWTFICWIVALVWAVKADPPPVVHYVQR